MTSELYDFFSQYKKFQTVKLKKQIFIKIRQEAFDRYKTELFDTLKGKPILNNIKTADMIAERYEWIKGDKFIFMHENGYTTFEMAGK